MAPRGRGTRKLRQDQIERLTKFRVAQRYSLPVLRSAMSAPFSWETLKKALDGLPVWDISHAYIVQWIDRFLPELPDPATPVRDGKAAAAGEREDVEEFGPAVQEAVDRAVDDAQAVDDAEKKAGTTRTLRGSR